MLQGLMFGLGVGAGIQAWRNWPPQANVSADTLAVVFCGGLVVAYFAGRFASRGRASAVATATATATADSVASSNVNVAFFVPGHGAGSATGGVAVPTDAA